MSKQNRVEGMSNKLLIIALLVGLIAIATSTYALLNPQPQIVYNRILTVGGTHATAGAGLGCSVNQ